MNPFYVVGALLAIWAVVLAVLGIRRQEFPRARGGAKAVMGISITLAVCAIAGAVVGGALEEDEEAEAEPPSEAAPEAAGEGEQLGLEADPSGDFSFDVAELQAKAGETTLVMSNPSSVEHNVSLEGSGVDEEGETVPMGETSTVSADLQPGEYTFYCSVPGHREGGMEGALAVE